jgi:hypothetical protein
MDARERHRPPAPALLHADFYRDAAGLATGGKEGRGGRGAPFGETGPQRVQQHCKLLEPQISRITQIQHQQVIADQGNRDAVPIPYICVICGSAFAGRS